MSQFRVRARRSQTDNQVHEIEVDATSVASARKMVEDANKGCVVVQVIDVLHEKRVEVAEQLAKLASYAKHPAGKAVSVFSRPTAEIVVTIAEEVERQFNQGVKNAQTIAQSIFKSFGG